MPMYGSGSGTFSGSNSMGEYDSLGYGFSPYDPGVGLWDPRTGYAIPSTSDGSGNQGMMTPAVQQAPSPPPENPLFAQARSQAQMDMNLMPWGGGGQMDGYQTPQMNPYMGTMGMGAGAPFSFGSLFGSYGGK